MLPGIRRAAPSSTGLECEPAPPAPLVSKAQGEQCRSAGTRHDMGRMQQVIILIAGKIVEIELERNAIGDRKFRHCLERPVPRRLLEEGDTAGRTGRCCSEPA